MRRHTPAVLGGLLAGVLSSLPVLSACCCLWAVCGGLLCAYLQQQREPAPLETAEAVLGGLIAGVIGAIIASIVPVVLITMSGSTFQDMMRAALEENSQLPPEWREQAMTFLTGRSIGFFLFVVNIIMYPVFSLLGSLLGVAIFRKKVPPATQA